MGKASIDRVFHGNQNYINTNNVNFVPRTHHNNGGWGRHGGCGRR